MAKALHTDEVKARAIALAVEHGPAEAIRLIAAEGHTIKPVTLRSWCSRAGVATVAAEKTAAATKAATARRDERREHLRVLLLDKAVDMLERMDLPHIDFRGKDALEVTFPKPSASGCQSYAVAAGTLLDKFRLEMGEATGRVEHATPTEQVHAIVDELAARRRVA